MVLLHYMGTRVSAEYNCGCDDNITNFNHWLIHIFYILIHRVCGAQLTCTNGYPISRFCALHIETIPTYIECLWA